jgi:hypothetical protein
VSYLAVRNCNCLGDETVPIDKPCIIELPELLVAVLNVGMSVAQSLHCSRLPMKTEIALLSCASISNPLLCKGLLVWVRMSEFNWASNILPTCPAIEHPQPREYNLSCYSMKLQEIRERLSFKAVGSELGPFYKVDPHSDCSELDEPEEASNSFVVSCRNTA